MAGAVESEDRLALVAIPQPAGLPVVGNTFQLDLQNTLMSMLDLVRPLGPICRLSFGGSTYISISGRDLLNEICDETRFKKVISAELEKLRPAVHDGLFTAHNDEPNWGVAHRILMPVFGPLKIRDMFPQMKDLANQLCLKWAHYGEAYTIDIVDDFTRLTLDTIAFCAMGYRFNSFHNGTEVHPFVGSMVRTLKEASTQAMLPDALNTFRFGSRRKLGKDIAFMRGLCEDIIARRKEFTTESEDLLKVLMEGRDPTTGQALSDESIIDNMITFLIAGHETTSGMLSFTFFYLMTHDDAMRKARKEVDDIVGKTPVRLEHLGKLSYLNATLRESLRLQPTAPGFVVGATQDEIIGGKYRIPANEPIMVLLHLAHRDISVFGEDADDFVPERMMDQAFNNLPPNSWKPFGNGMRGCIGRSFAWQEALLIAAMLLQNFDFEMNDPKYTLKVKDSLTIKPEGFQVRARQRHAELIVEHSSELSTDNLAHPAPLKARPRSQCAETKLPIVVLHGSNSGTCEALAYRLATDAGFHGYNATTISTMDSATGSLQEGIPTVFLAASYNGLPSDNAVIFIAWLKSLPDAALSGVEYAVFGCGHRDWPSTLHHVPILLDSLLEKAGAQRIAPLGLADSATGDLFVELEEWASTNFWPSIKSAEGRSAGIDAERRFIHDLLHIDVLTPRAAAQHAQLKQATVIESRALTDPKTGGRKHHLQLQLSSEASLYKPGDHFIVLPTNPLSSVRRALARFCLAWDTTIEISGDESTRIPTDYPLTAFELLSAYFELSQQATRRDVMVLAVAAEKSTDKTSSAALLRLADEDYKAEIQDNRYSILDLLDKFHDVEIPFATFLAMLPPLRLRTYSISSSPSAVPQQASLTISVVDEPARSRSGRFLGVASNFLSSLAPGDILYGAPKSVKGVFRPPSDPSTIPVIMIAAGSGIAPFRGFIQERAWLQEQGMQLAPGLLFFGCRSPADDLYREELDGFEACAAIQIYRAFSRATEADTESTSQGYVQHSIHRHKDVVTRLWHMNAKIYVCGSKKMATEVKDTVAQLLHDSLSSSDDEGQRMSPLDWFKQYEPSRYAVEVFT